MSNEHDFDGVRFENPDAMPAYIYVEPPIDSIAERRGRAWFAMLEELGVRVQRAEGGVQAVTIYEPWTFLYSPAPFENVVDTTHKLTVDMPCSVVYDCIGSIGTIPVDNRDAVLANLRAACAVTVSNAAWAAEFAEINPNTWYLPDIEDNHRSIHAFGVKFSEMVNVTQRRCVTR